MITLYLLFKTTESKNPRSPVVWRAKIIGVSSHYEEQKPVLGSILSAQRLKYLNRELATPIEFGDDRTLRIPETVMFNGKSYVVTDLTLGRTHKDIPEVECLMIPKTVTHIDIRGFECSRFMIEDNCVFSEIDSVVFKGTSLECYPSLKEAEDYVIPEGTSIITSGAFFRCKNLKHISIPRSVKEIGIDAFMFCKKIQRINIPDEVRIVGSILYADRGAPIKDMYPTVSFRGKEYDSLLQVWIDCFSEEDCYDEGNDRHVRRVGTTSYLYDDDDILSAIAHGNGDLLGIED